MASVDHTVEIALKYATSVIGTPYQYWSHSLADTKNEPMWVSDDPVPTSAKTINCSGLVNLMRRSVGLPVPGIAEQMECPGGTYAWVQYLNNKNVLHAFDYTSSYPIGTLFLREYQSETDQGHISVLYDTNPRGSLYSHIIHSCTSSGFIENESVYPGVTIDHTLGESHFYDGSGYYQYYCLPEDWLI